MTTSAWGKSWGSAWGNAWKITGPPPIAYTGRMILIQPSERLVSIPPSDRLVVVQS